MLSALIDLTFVICAIGLFAPGPDGAFIRRITGLAQFPVRNQAPTQRECVIEERKWINGVEVVSRVNYSQLARVCRDRGLRPDAVATPRIRWASPQRATPAIRRAAA